MNITAPIRHRARTEPDAVAIIGGDDRRLSYAALDQAIDRMAGHAARLGLRAGDLVALPIEPPDEVTAFVLALALARVGVASGELSLPQEHVRLRLQSGARVPPGRVRFDAAWMEGSAADVALHPDPNVMCRVFASSGTTGMPKHVPVSHAQMAQRVIARWVGLGGGRDVHMVTLGLGGAWGFVTALRLLWQGGTLVVPNAGDPTAAIGRHAVTTISASPVALHALLELLPASAGPFPALRALELGGSAFPEPLYQRSLERLCANLVLHLGSSEVGGMASAPMTILRQRQGAVGYIWPNITIQAVDGDGNPLPTGEAGRLRVRGPAVADRYLGDTAETAERFGDGWFYSSDIGTVWPDGMLTLSGRTSELINRGGTKISPHLIEDALLRLPGVREAAAFGVPGTSGIEQIWAAIVADPPIEDAVLDAWCAAAPRAWAPEVVLQLEALPRNANGKIQRDRLIQLALTMTGSDGSRR